MEKKFNTLAKALKLLELEIEGTFGEGLTLSDFVKYDVPTLKEGNKKLPEGWIFYIVVREHGTFFRNSEHGAFDTFREWGDDSRYVVKIMRYATEKMFSLEVIKSR